MRIIKEEILLSRGHILSAEQQRRLDAQNMDRIPKEGMIIIYNERDIGRITGGFVQARRGCFKIVDTHSHPLLVKALECRAPGYYKEVFLYKNDFLHGRVKWCEVYEEYYAVGEDSLCWCDFDISKFEEGRRKLG